MSGFTVPFPSDDSSKKESKSVDNSPKTPVESNPVEQTYGTLYPSNSNTINKRKLKVSQEENSFDNEQHDVALTEDSPTTGSTVFNGDPPLEEFPISQRPINTKKKGSSLNAQLSKSVGVPFVITEDDDDMVSLPLTSLPPQSKPKFVPDNAPTEGVKVPPVSPSFVAEEKSIPQPVYEGITAREILSLEDIESLDAILGKLDKLVKLAEAKKTVVRAQNEVSKGLLD